ncbi:MAG: anaerobic C4-dicarboxylate transporter [Psychromonas sp.]|nr:anaerobic C4-dicarboxylate transporter [Psychromonas sp.]
MVYLEFFVVVFFIVLGARIGGIAIGLTGAGGVIVLSLVFGIKTTHAYIPIDVILIIMTVITAIAAMQVAGGINWLVQIAEGLLRKNPKRITYYAPILTYFMTLLAGTGHSAYSTLPVIAEVAKDQGFRPSRPLSIAVVASQVANTASPISAAVVVLSDLLAPVGVSYLELLTICIPSSFIACMFGAFVASKLGCELQDDLIYKERVKKGLISKSNLVKKVEVTAQATQATFIFIGAIVLVIFYAAAISDSITLIKHPTIGRNEAIMAIMLTAAGFIVFFTKIDPSKMANATTFKSGMTACVLGVAWLGSTFINTHVEDIKQIAGGLLQTHPWLLAIILFFASMLLYSQGATTVALMPAALAISVAPLTVVASFAAVSTLFVLPTYPTLLAAIEIDQTGSTRIGNLVFNHTFIIPGIATIAMAVTLAFVIGNIVL